MYFGVIECFSSFVTWVTRRDRSSLLEIQVPDDDRLETALIDVHNMRFIACFRRCLSIAAGVFQRRALEIVEEWRSTRRIISEGGRSEGEQREAGKDSKALLRNAFFPVRDDMQEHKEPGRGQTDLMRPSLAGQIFRSFSFNRPSYSPQMIKKSDSTRLALAMIAILGQALSSNMP